MEPQIVSEGSIYSSASGKNDLECASQGDWCLKQVPLESVRSQVISPLTMSNITSTSGEASPSSCNVGEDGGEGSAILQHQQGSTFPEATTVGNTGQATAKRKRNLPGTPDPDAEVVTLSPNALLATNRFICEICHKGFPRDQNLQLHRRGHNLPWKLRQRTSKEKRRRVYICPEPSCVHHDPARALGDLTGIKKHFSRKHGEKKWKCDKCSKRYAVQSDWKAHSKTCGTREYRCDCGTLFSRRDSFITHRAFCDALAEETARVSASQLQDHQVLGAGGVSLSVMETLSSPISRHGMPGVTPKIAGQSHLSGTPSEILVGSRPNLSFWLRGEPSSSEQQQLVIGGSQQLQAGGSMFVHGLHSKQPFFVPCSNMRRETDSKCMPTPEYGQKPFPSLIAGFAWNHSDRYGGLLSRQVECCGMMGVETSELADPGNAMNWSFNRISASSVLSRSAGIPKNASSSIVNLCDTAESHSAHMSATALLQKAAQIGATSSYPFLVGSNTSFSAILERDHTKAAIRQPCSVTKDSELPSPTQGLVSSFSSIGNTSLNKLMNSLSASSNVFGGSTNYPLSPSRCFARDMEAKIHSLENAGSCQNVRSLEKLRFQRAASHERQSIAGSSMPCSLERAEDGRSDSLTRDFLGIGGLRKVFSQKNHVSVPSLGIGVDNMNNSCKNRDNLGCLAVHTSLLESRRILNDKND